jgi:allophanate hydrolase subunit 1
MSEKKIITSQQLNAEQATRNVDIALHNFPSYLVFCTGVDGGFVMMFSPSEAMEKQLQAQIRRSLQQKPELKQFFVDLMQNL